MISKLSLRTIAVTFFLLKTARRASIASSGSLESLAGGRGAILDGLDVQGNVCAPKSTINRNHTVLNN